jgi:hypothetical protein
VTEQSLRTALPARDVATELARIHN